jgi:hypothetical protein
MNIKFEIKNEWNQMIGTILQKNTKDKNQNRWEIKRVRTK